MAKVARSYGVDFDKDHPGHGGRHEQAERVVRDLLALHFEMPEDAVGQIEIVPVLDAALARK